jgi:[ribosomal protein S18]-alanine N-acetyltransferase
VSLRVEPVSSFTAGLLSMLHCACFPEDPWNLPAITDLMGIAGFFGRIAWEHQMPAGFALALDLGKECEILSLGVLPERRRSGIGSALLDSVCFEARLRSAEQIVLEVAVDNSMALALYTVRGFIPIARRWDYYRRAGCRVDALVLRLTLADATITP